MATNWRDNLSKKQKEEIKALRDAEKQRNRELREDKHYRYMKAGLTASLKKAQKREPELVAKFFNKFGFFTPSKLAKSQIFLAAIKDMEIQAFFNRYLNFAARFGVVWKCHPKSRSFKVHLQVPWGTSFLGRIERGRLVPSRPFIKDEATIHLFERPDLLALPKLEEEIRGKNAAYVQIEDESGSSVLSQLEAFSYRQGGVSFVLHNAEQPYILCLVGEKVDSQTWQRAGKIIKEFRKTYFRRVNAGRPPNLKRFDKVMKLRNRNQPLKNAASDLSGETGNWGSNKVLVSRAAKRAQI